MMKVFVVRWVVRMLPIIYMNVIWYQSSHFRPQVLETGMPITLASMGGVLENSHYYIFGILYVLLILAALTFGPLTAGKQAFALIVSCLYAVIDEIHQSYVPFRSASMEDLVKNYIGIGTAFIVIGYLYFRAPDSMPSVWMKKLEPKKR